MGDPRGLLSCTRRSSSRVPNTLTHTGLGELDWEATTASPISRSSGVRMFARCPEDPIHPVTTRSAHPYPQARFSAHREYEYPDFRSRSVKVEPHSCPIQLVVLSARAYALAHSVRSGCSSSPPRPFSSLCWTIPAIASATTRRLAVVSGLGIGLAKADLLNATRTLAPISPLRTGRYRGAETGLDSPA